MRLAARRASTSRKPPASAAAGGPPPARRSTSSSGRCCFTNADTRWPKHRRARAGRARVATQEEAGAARHHRRRWAPLPAPAPACPRPRRPRRPRRRRTVGPVAVHRAKKRLVLADVLFKRETAVLIGLLVARLAPRAAHGRDGDGQRAPRLGGARDGALLVLRRVAELRLQLLRQLLLRGAGMGWGGVLGTSRSGTPLRAAPGRAPAAAAAACASHHSRPLPLPR
jgi:hypothetical protein